MNPSVPDGCDVLDIEVGPSDPECIQLAIRVEIDLLTCEPFEHALQGVADGRVVQLDLGEVGYMDSTGLRALLNGRRAIEGAGGRLLVIELSAPTRRLFELAGLADEFA